jgi:lysophospholipase L1-like esterase
MGNICIFGDSIVWGAFDPFNGGWANLLRNYLESKNSEVECYNLGVSGNNSSDLLKRFEIEASARSPSLIIIAIGTNDSYYINKKDNHRVSQKDFESNLKKLINISKKFTSNLIMLTPNKVDETKTKPIPWNKKIFYENDSIKKYGQIIKNLSEKNNILFIDLFDLLENKDFYDGLHPNSEGHKKIFEIVKNFLEKIDY